MYPYKRIGEYNIEIRIASDLDYPALSHLYLESRRKNFY